MLNDHMHWLSLRACLLVVWKDCCVIERTLCLLLTIFPERLGVLHDGYKTLLSRWVIILSLITSGPLPNILLSCIYVRSKYCNVCITTRSLLNVMNAMHIEYSRITQLSAYVICIRDEQVESSEFGSNNISEKNHNMITCCWLQCLYIMILHVIRYSMAGNFRGYFISWKIERRLQK